MEMGIRLLKHIGKIIAVIGLTVTVAGVLMILVYLIPTERMFENAKRSVEIFEIEGSSAQMIHGYPSTALDNYTDTWMLRIAFYDGEESAADKAFHNYYYHGDREYADVCQSTIAYLKDTNPGKNRAEYARYWHGYLLILKPLLFLFDYGTIRQILKICSLFFVLYLTVLLERVGLKEAVFPFGGMLVFLEFATIGMSMQYTWVFLLAMFFSVLILKKHKVWERGAYNWIFLIIGCLTSFFDFLTYPLITLAVPLLMLCMCYEMQERKGVKIFLWHKILLAVHWAVGYVGMWCGKWICLVLFWGDGAIQDAVNSILERSGKQDAEYTWIETVWENVNVLLKWPYLLCAVFVLGMILLRSRKEEAFRIELFIAYCGIAGLPFAWYFISLNHSYIHAAMTYRELSITAFAGSLAVLELKKAWNRRNGRNQKKD
ncbi:MAG: hypothetical protein NC302_11770 [Bacteroidales bacterium]|nr:hypothetical protein [Bacteroidales bacterium]MCM1416549.1 hypothetical protein [bacterium]MCM1424852.1 hypothetical protein [bacterium]